MEHHRTRTEGGPHSALGVSWEGRPAALLPTIAGKADVIEVVPDALRGSDGRVNRDLLEQLDRHAPDTPLTYHGIGLSIGSAGGWNDDHLRLLDEVLAWREPLWHSEHLGFTHVEGAFLGTLPALPTTEESLALVIDRSRAMRSRYGHEFLLELAMTAPADDRPALPEPWVWDRDPWLVATAIAEGHDPADVPAAEAPILVYRDPDGRLASAFAG